MEIDFPRGGARSQAQKSAKLKRNAISSNGPAAKKSTNDINEDNVETLFKKALTPDLLSEGVRGIGSIVMIENDFLILKTLNEIDVIVPLPNISRIYAETFRSTGLTLKDMFVHGQLLAFKIEKAITQKKKQKNDRIIGSICPSHVNDCVHSSNLLNGLVLNGAVKSIEEKGVIFDLGIEEEIEGFANFDSIPTVNKLKIGQVIMIRIIRESSDLKKYIKVSGYPEMDTFEEENMKQNQFMPGTILHANPETITNGGVVVSFKNGLKAFISKEYLPPRLRGDLVKLVKAFRVVVVICSQNSPLLYVSGHPDIVAISKAERRILPNEFAVGEFIEGITYSVDKNNSVYFVVQEGDDKVSLITAKMPSTKVASTETMKKYYPGTSHKLRILRYSPLDRRVIVTDKKEILKSEKIVEEYQPGQLVTAKIESIVDIGLRVLFARNCRGTIFVNHTLDIISTSWKKAFKPNQKVRCRILYKEKLKNQYCLTAKPTLVNSTDTIVHEYNSELVGKTATGMCVFTELNGAVIVFYDKITGYLPKRQADLLPEELKVGMPVTVKIAKVDVENEKITLAVDKIGKELIKAKVLQEKPEKATKPIKPVRNLHIYQAKLIGLWPFGGTSEDTSILVELPENNIGRLHVSEMGLKLGENVTKFMEKNKNKKINVRVIQVLKFKKLGKIYEKKLENRRQIDQFYEVTIIPEKLKELKMKQKLLLPKLHYKLGSRVKVYLVNTSPNDKFQRAELNPFFSCYILPETHDYKIDDSTNSYGMKSVHPVFRGKAEPIEGEVVEKTGKTLYLSLSQEKIEKELGKNAVGRVAKIKKDPLRYEIRFCDGSTATLPGNLLTKKLLSTDELEQILKRNDLVYVKFVEENEDEGWIVSSATFEESYDKEQIKIAIATAVEMKNDGEESSILHKEKLLMKKEKSKDLFTDMDYDRMILSKPNSSETWISYIAHQASKGNMEEARKIAENALTTISPRENAERLNIYTAYMNLEVALGDEESLKQIFQRASNAHEPYEVHKRLANVLKKVNKNEDLDRLYQVMIKKFGKHRSEVFILYGTFLHQIGKHDEARELINKAMQILPKKQHVETLSRFANLEYTYGDIEKARTMFEKVLSVASTRGDIWNIYVDKAIKHHSVDEVRDIFERAIDVKLGLQTTKNLFQKWQDFEKVKGDKKHAKIVKEKALDYTKNVMKVLEHEDEENDDD